MYIINKKEDYIKPYNKSVESKSDYIKRIVSNIESIVVDIEDIKLFDIVDSDELEQMKEYLLSKCLDPVADGYVDAAVINNNSEFNSKLIYAIVSNLKLKSKEQFDNMDINLFKKYESRLRKLEKIAEEDEELKLFGVIIDEKILNEEHNERILKEGYVRDYKICNSSSKEILNNQNNKRTVII